MRIKLTEQHEIPALYDIFIQDGIEFNFCADPTVITELNLGSWLLKTEPGTASKSFTIYSDNNVCGVVTINNISHIKNSAYIGVIAIKSGVGGLIGVKAAKWIINYAFETLNLNRLYAHTWADNTKMDSLYKRIGATHEGTEREHTWKQGSYVDMKIWGILRREYGTSS